MTLVIGVISADGPVVVADGLTTGTSKGAMSHQVKAANIPSGSPFAVLVSGRATFAGVLAIEECRTAVEASPTQPNSVGDLADILFTHFSRWTALDNEAESFEAVCIARGGTNRTMTYAAATIFSFVGPHGRVTGPSQERSFTAGDGDAQESALKFIEELASGGQPVDYFERDPFDESLDQLAMSSASEVAKVLSRAIQEASTDQIDSGRKLTVGTATTSLLLDPSGKVVDLE